MPKWVHRTTKQLLRSIASADLPEPQVNYIEEPDLSALAGIPTKYWNIVGDIVSEMSQGEKDAVDAAEAAALLTGERDDEKVKISANMALRALGDVTKDEINLLRLHVNAVLDAIDGASNVSQIKTAVAAIPDLSPRTLGQLQTAMQNKIDAMASIPGGQG